MGLRGGVGDQLARNLDWSLNESMNNSQSNSATFIVQRWTDLEDWFYTIAMIAERNVAITTTTTAEIDTPFLGLVAACTF